MRKYVVALLAVGAVLIGVLVLTSGGDDSSGDTANAKAGSGGTVVIRQWFDPDTLDPARTTGGPTYQFLFALYDRLVAIGPDGEVLPALATSWEQSPDSVTLRISEDATCADGTEITPTVVAESLRYLGAPSTRAPYAYRVFGTDGYEVEADDGEGTVTITTREPFSDLLVGLSSPSASIICPAGLRDPASMRTKPAGSGPYDLTSIKKGASYTLTARDGYTWGPDGASTSRDGAPSEIRFVLNPNDSTVANQLVTGEMNIAGITGPDVERVAADASVGFEQKRTGFGAHFLLLNQRDGHPGTDPLVRQAVNAAIDAQDYIQAFSGGQDEVATSIVSSAVPCYSPEAQDFIQGQDVDEAKQLLEQAGYGDGRPLKLQILVQAAGGNAPDYLVEALRAVGIEATARAVPQETYAADVAAGKWDLTVVWFSPSLPSMNSFTTFASGPAEGNNFGGISDPEFDAAAKAALSAGPDQVCEEWGKAQEALFRNNDIKPLLHPVTTWFGNDDWTYQPMSNYELDPLSLVKSAE